VDASRLNVPVAMHGKGLRSDVDRVSSRKFHYSGCTAGVAYRHAYGAMPNEVCIGGYLMLHCPQGVPGAAEEAWQL
jgi:hypothetical protein